MRNGDVNSMEFRAIAHLRQNNGRLQLSRLCHLADISIMSIDPVLKRLPVSIEPGFPKVVVLNSRKVVAS